MIQSKCGHCPLIAEDRECPGQKNRRACERADPRSSIHDPGIIRQILGFAGAVVRHVAAGTPTVTDEQKAARLAICQACENFEPGRDRCRVCGCGLSLKASWADQSCPLDPPKWGAITSPPAGSAEPSGMGG